MYKRFLLTLLVVLMVLASASVPVRAQEKAPTIASPQVVPMYLDCGSLKGSALQYAKKHNYCSSNQPSQGLPSPENIVWGDCGYSYLWIDDIGVGQARFRMGAESTLGAMASVSYSTSWYNWDTSASGVRSGTDYPLSSIWTRSRTATTGAGYVTAVMTGTVTLIWGGTCYFNGPSDYLTID